MCYYNLMRKKVKFVLNHFNINPKVKVRLKKMKNMGETHVKKKHYEIRINPKINKHLQLITLFHELVHVKQYELDGLYMSNELMMFKGERFDNDLAYHWQPWEIEARGMEEALLQEWLTHKKKS